MELINHILGKYGSDDVIKTEKVRYLESVKILMSIRPLIGSEIICRIYWVNDKLILVKRKVYYHYDDVIFGPDVVTKHKICIISILDWNIEVIFRSLSSK